VEYEAELKINPGRFDSLYGAGRAAEMAKLPDKAISTISNSSRFVARGTLVGLSLPMPAIPVHRRQGDDRSN